MKVKQIISEMPAMNRSDIGFGMTQYLNDRYALVGGYRSGSSNAGETRLKYDIYSVELVEKFGPEKGKIGFVEFRVSDEDGEILGLINIELSPKFRKGGHGAKIIQDIKDTTQAGGFDVHDIQKKAKKFWDKVGIKYTNNQNTQGRIGETLGEAGGPLITYLNDKGKKVTGRVAKRSTNSPKGYFLDTGEFVSQQRVIAKESLEEASGKLVKNMRVQHIHNGNTGTVVKGGDKAGGRVEVEWDDGTTTVTSGKYLEKAKKINEAEDGPFYALVIFGPDSKKKKIKFKNQAQFEKWSEKHDGNYELLSFQDIDESLNEVSPELLDRASKSAGDKWHTAMNKGLDAQKRRDVKGMADAGKEASKRREQELKFKNKSIDKQFSEATPDEEEVFHQELDNLVHRTFGNSEVERQDEDKDPCWKGYKQIGMKKKGGKEVPNCVPVNENEITVEDADEIYGTFDNSLLEAEYQGRKVELNKPMQGDVKKFKVYVKNDKGNVVKVNFGDPNMRIKKSNPERRKSFRARHNCDNPGPKWKARYWSCRAW